MRINSVLFSLPFNQCNLIFDLLYLHLFLKNHVMIILDIEMRVDLQLFILFINWQQNMLQMTRVFLGHAG